MQLTISPTCEQLQLSYRAGTMNIIRLDSYYEYPYMDPLVLLASSWEARLDKTLTHIRCYLGLLELEHHQYMSSVCHINTY